jgi:hypothetical protein
LEGVLPVARGGGRGGVGRRGPEAAVGHFVCGRCVRVSAVCFWSVFDKVNCTRKIIDLEAAVV